MSDADEEIKKKVAENYMKLVTLEQEDARQQKETHLEHLDFGYKNEPIMKNNFLNKQIIYN